MQSIQVLFWDVGGVLLTNAWDHTERDRASAKFSLNKEDFERRHKEVVADFEQGKLSLDDYLARVVFYQTRNFSRDEFRKFMFSLSQPKPEVLEFARVLSTKYLMGTINNESRELNEYRLQQFGLREIFDLFVSSCYVGLRKPGEQIYRLALDLIQKSADQCCFIDDRPENLEGAAKVGMPTVLMQNPVQLKRDLQNLGVSSAA
ncbi:MAG TPA: HAD family phosphatase [Terriglobales bacterium]|nr:HAD family phosphatase [Terriglobales bacterium]